ncbi:phosphatidylserine decarboxylase proenzyme 1, mitochondrial [Punica granatum]|uniref:Phosphatidylserine decarboxylase proenzyme 1, mitochondrial n=2 Tax=Punica granatum TaxID=22663 RepID=A0A2I0IC45_PUNGR|nr:phosphatidylserine decarboxylase proenzyme 1, mitochondrial [Punica granatum]PKI41554.1 hypothetical protein CRG98_038065 [Punica granatum]
MKFRASNKLPLFPHHRMALHHLQNQRRFLTSFFAKKVHQAAQARASFNGGGRADSNGGSYLVPGATVATILMLGALHARRLYEDKKVEEARERGVEFEFQPDVKASFLRFLPLRTISRFWGHLTSVEVPVWLRPYLCRAWARAFHSNLEEVALPLEEYASLQEFFVRSLKEGSRPIDPDPKCLISPVDGIVLRFGELKSTGAMIEQVKGFSYSVASLLGANSILPMMAERTHKEDDLIDNPPIEQGKKSWWRVSLASPRVRDPVPGCPVKGLFYCVIYLKPGDYHRIHSPADWKILGRRHFSGRLFPLNERATRTIRNLYVENERVVLEGLWQQGFMGMAAIGATNIGSIELYIEPELRTNCPKKKLLQSEPPEERFYEPEGVEITVKRGDEVAAFNMGSTVVLVFQAPTSESSAKDESSGFSFCVKKGERVRVGSALGRWHETNSEV